MILPSTYVSGLIVLILALVCLGSWINTLRAAGKLRFELYSYDFALGVLVAALIAAFTLGSLNSKELTFADNFSLTGYRKMAWGMGAAAVFGLGNLFLLASTVTSRVSVAFPVSFGLALLINTVWDYFLSNGEGAVLIFGGLTLILVAMIVAGVSYRWNLLDLQAEMQRAFIADPRTKAPPKVRGSAALSVTLGLLSGVFLGISSRMLGEATTGDNALAPYSAGLMFAAGFFLASLVYVPFFMNFPVAGAPIRISDYFKAKKKQHLMGILGGMIFIAGLLAALAATYTPAFVQAGPLVNFAINQSVPIIAALWGLLVWREYKGASNRVQMALAVLVVLYLAGVGMIAVARRG
jgi:glucose uptake protein